MELQYNSILGFSFAAKPRHFMVTTSTFSHHKILFLVSFLKKLDRLLNQAFLELKDGISLFSNSRVLIKMHKTFYYITKCLFNRNFIKQRIRINLWCKSHLVLLSLHLIFKLKHSFSFQVLFTFRLINPLGYASNYFL